MYILILLLSLQQILFGGTQEALAYGRLCPIRPLLLRKIVCTRGKFQCLNGHCIGRSAHCDGQKAHGCDGSDEKYCNTKNCPVFFTKCKSSNKCIPNEWICDGHPDCPSSEDENKCENFGTYSKTGQSLGEATRLNLELLHTQSKRESATDKWGYSADKMAVMLHLVDDSLTENEIKNEIAYEVSIQLLSRLLRTKLQDISSYVLASFVNAFLVSCIDPRKFHGFDIVQELRNRVDRQNYTNPYVLLSLCNAGDTITESDKFKLNDTFWKKRHTFRTDMQAVSVMALSCASKQTGNGVDIRKHRELMIKLKHQFRNGSIENLQTTALVMQALLSVEPDADPDNFDEGRALEQMLESQKADGSFGNFMNSYFVLPILNCKSLVNINTDHCKTVWKDEMLALEDLTKQSGPKIRVQYSLWIGDENYLERNLVLRVPANLSLYEIMELAAELDSRYRFEYRVKNQKRYVNAISDIQDNPESGKLWFLYVVKDGVPSTATESPAEIIPNNDDHYVMWYRGGTWNEL